MFSSTFFLFFLFFLFLLLLITYYHNSVKVEENFSIIDNSIVNNIGQSFNNLFNPVKRNFRLIFNDIYTNIEHFIKMINFNSK